MNIKTYLDKTNTIVYNSLVNTGQNPVCELYYGDGFTRVLLHFDTSKISALIDDKTFADTTKLKHILKLKNCWGLQTIDSRSVFNSGKDTVKERTSSFDLYLIRIPELWDAGVGNEFTKDGFITKQPSLSYNASNWFNSGTEKPWYNGNGVLSEISSTDIIAIQHFDIGNEDIEIDLTDEINNILSGNTDNNGFMLKFVDQLEQTTMNKAQYVGFFTQNSNTFFKPFIESTYDDVISDDRNDFYLDKDNKLYFYSIIGGHLTNLDQLPTCSISEEEKVVYQASKGVYYIELNLSSQAVQENEMIYDIWSNIIFNHITFNDVELDFVTKTSSNYFDFGNSKIETKKYTTNIFGINNDQKVDRGQRIKIGVQAREEFTINKSINSNNMEIRIYVKEVDKQFDVISWDKIEKGSTENYYMLDTDSLLPNKYYIDIKMNVNNEIKIHKELLVFNIVNKI